MPDTENKTPEQIAREKQEAEDTALWVDLEANALALSAKNNGRKIMPFVVTDRDDVNSERIVGYMFELDAMSDAKLYAAQLTGAESAIMKALEASESIVLWNDSDSRLNTKKYRKGVALNILAQVEQSTPLLKKK